MIIKSLELENIRSYTKEKIEFQEGITSLSGDIGSGKSSILQAIEFAFFGFKKGDLEGIHLLRKGEQVGSVTLNLTNQKDLNIEIFRELKKSKTAINQSNAYLKINNELIELTPSELNFKIFELLNFPKEFLTKDKNLIYRFTIYTPQEQLKEIIFAQQDKRLEVIRKLFSIDKYKQLKTAIEIYYKSLKEQKNIIQAKLEPIEDNLKNLKNKLSDTQELVEQKENLTNKLEPIIKNLDIIKENKIKIEEKQNQYHQLELKLEKQIQQLQDLKVRKEEINQELEEINKTKEKYQDINFEKELEKIKSNLNQKEEQKNKLKKSQDKLKQEKQEKQSQEKQILDINQKIQLLKNDLKHIDIVLTQCKIQDRNVELKKIQKKIRKQEKQQKELEDLKENISKKNIQIQQLKESLETYTSQITTFENITKCSLCHQEVSQEHKNIIKQDINSKITQIKEESEKLTIQIDKDNIKVSSLNIELNTYQQNLANQISIQETIQQLQEQLIIEKKQSQEKQKQIEILQSSLPKNLQEDNKNNYDQKQEELQKKLEEVQEEIYKLQQQKDNFNFQKEDFDQKQKQQESLKEKLIKIQTNLNLENQIKEKLNILKEKKQDLDQKQKQNLISQEKYQTSKEDLNEKLTQVKTKIQYQKQTKEEYENLLKIQQNHKINQDKLKENEDLIINHTSPLSSLIEKTIFTKFYVEFNEHFEQIFKQLIEDNEIEVRLDSEFSIIVEQNGYDISMNNLSGGEKSSLAIAYRLALKEIIQNNTTTNNNLNLLILDEPTDGFSQEQVERLGNLLKENNLQQTILVSHDKKIESIADNSLYVHKMNHKSTIGVN